MTSDCLKQRILRESRSLSSSPGRDTPPRRIWLIDSEGDDLLPEDNSNAETTIHTGQIFPVSVRQDDDCNAVIASDNVSLQFVVNINPMEQEIAGPSGVESKENDGFITSIPDESSSNGRVPDVHYTKKGVMKMCTYDVYLRKKFSQDSSDDKIFEIETSVKLLESLK